MKIGGYLMIVMGIVLFFDWMTKIITILSPLFGGFTGFLMLSIAERSCHGVCNIRTFAKGCLGLQLPYVKMEVFIILDL